MSEEARPQVVLVRHGATEWSESGQHTGLTDLPLLEEGEDEARALAPLLAQRKFALVLSSPLERAVRTAELAGLADVEIEPDLLEWNYGKVEGRTTAEMREDDPDWTVFTGEIREGETAAEVGARVNRVIARCLAAGGDVALIGHGHCLRIVAALWLGLDVRDGRLLALGSGTISELDWEREQPVIKTWGLKPALVETEDGEGP
jgi:probable phosphoglycerate mutase